MAIAEAPWRPLCMDAEELARWEEMNGRLNGSAHAQLPCTDCRLAFAVEMRAIGRCNGSPHGVEEDEEMGTFDTGPRGLSIPQRVQLEVNAPPCGSCLHEPVCSLRAAFEDEGMATVETSAPPLPDGLRLALVATVECSHFLRDRAKPAPVRVLTAQERGQANGPGAKRTSHDWTAEQRAAQGDRMRARNAAAREGAAAG
jgi:hypothetical protein